MCANRNLVADPITGRTMTSDALDILKRARETALDWGYTLDEHDRILGPGRFEGEGVDVIYFDDAMSNGDGDILETHDDGYSCTSLVLSDAEREAFADPDSVAAVLEITSQGFVSVSYVTADALATLTEDIARDEAEADSDDPWTDSRAHDSAEADAARDENSDGMRDDLAP